MNYPLLTISEVGETYNSQNSSPHSYTALYEMVLEKQKSSKYGTSKYIEIFEPESNMSPPKT